MAAGLNMGAPLQGPGRWIAQSLCPTELDSVTEQPAEEKATTDCGQETWFPGLDKSQASLGLSFSL